MFGIRARNVALALSLLAAVATSLAPGSPIAAAAALPADVSMTETQADTSVRVLGTPRPRIVFFPKELAVHEIFRHQTGPVNSYLFHVQAVHGTLHHVTATTGSQYTSVNGGPNKTSPLQVVDLGTIIAPSYGQVQFTCNPPIGYYCENVGVSVTSTEGVNITFADGTDGVPRTGY
jgi:hypothetical protein